MSPMHWLKDKYDLSWQIIPTALGEMLGDNDPQKASRVMQAMLQMDKVDIEGWKRAYEGRVSSRSGRARLTAGPLGAHQNLSFRPEQDIRGANDPAEWRNLLLTAQLPYFAAGPTKATLRG